MDPKPGSSEELHELTDFASVRRYEEGTFVVTRDETDAAIKLVEAPIAFADSQIP